MADNLPLNIKNPDGYAAHKGAVLVLVYLTPPNTTAWDSKAYAQIIALHSVTEATAATAGTSYPNVSLLTVHPYSRVTDRVWQATVVLAQDGIIGELVPKSLSPGPDAQPANLYTLQSVELWRDSANWLQSVAVSAQNLLDPATNAVNSVAQTVQNASDSLKLPDVPKPDLPSVGTVLFVGALIAAGAYVVSHRGLAKVV